MRKARVIKKHLRTKRCRASKSSNAICGRRKNFAIYDAFFRYF